MIGSDKTQMFTYPPKKLRRRILRVCELTGMSMSRVLTLCAEACIDDLEQNGIVIKAKPIQVARNTRTRAA